MAPVYEAVGGIGGLRRLADAWPPDGLAIPRWSWDGGPRSGRGELAHQLIPDLSDAGHHPVRVRSKLYRDAR
jgi:hypothetical protein